MVSSATNERFSHLSQYRTQTNALSLSLSRSLSLCLSLTHSCNNKIDMRCMPGPVPVAAPGTASDSMTTWQGAQEAEAEAERGASDKRRNMRPAL